MTKPIKIHASQVEMIPLADLKRFEKNPMVHPEAQLAALERIILDSGFTTPLLIDKANVIIGGHGRAMVAERIGMTEVPCVRVKGLSAAQVKALRVSDNKLAELSMFDPDLLRTELLDLKDLGFDLALTGFGLDEIEEMLRPASEPIAPGPSLMDRFGVAPFSVLNAREGWWQDRKAAWLGLGIRSEVGRGENVLDMSAAMAGITDPGAVEHSIAQRRQGPSRKAEKAAPGGSPRPAMKTAGGKTQRGVGRGRVLDGHG